MVAVEPLIDALSLAPLAIGAGYALLAVVATLTWRTRTLRVRTPVRPPITLLAPLCGPEPNLYLRLRSFCDQDYPDYQVVFGVQNSNDPVIVEVERLKREFPTLPISLVVNPTLHGANRKVSNLINMLPIAAHDILVMADSDAWVGRDYLLSVTSPLQDAGVGLVTCLSRGVPTSGIWSHLGAMYFNDWYMPSVVISRMFGDDAYASGQTLCIRKQTLRAIGGFEVLVDQLAEDYKIGELVRGLNLRIDIAPYVLQAEHHEPSCASLIQHELRWLRTIRVLRPRSFRWLFLSFSLPLGALGLTCALVATGLSSAAYLLFGIVVVARVMLHLLWRFRGRGVWLEDLWLLPFRDAFMVFVWCCSFLSTRVVWRGNEFQVHSDGILRSAS
jgi:ceramide glucosyltransferase